MAEGLALLNHRPITFYGKVVDQHGNSVVAARVRGTVLITRRFMEDASETHFTTTDTEGRFQFNDLKGKGIGIWPMKEGYEFKSENTYFSYSNLTPQVERHTPDKSAPALFTMWKLRGPEHLIQTKIWKRLLAVDGTPTKIDLVTGQPVADGGDLVITLRRDPLRIQPGQRFDWSATLEAPTGGLAEMNALYQNEAPAEGYDRSMSIEMRADSPKWQDEADRAFYLKSRDGQIYARVTVKIAAHYDPPPASIRLEAYVNPSGSRNLEYDPSKQASVR